MNFLPVVHNLQMDGTMSQIFYICLSFYFKIKNEKPFVIVVMTLKAILHYALVLRFGHICEQNVFAQRIV